jgi:outer membrane protein
MSRRFASSRRHPFSHLMKLARSSFSPVVGVCLQAIGRRARLFRLSRASALLPLAVVAAFAQPAAQPAVPDKLDLNTAIAFALENNFAIRQARERIKQQEGILIEVKSRSIPNAAINSSYSRFDRGLAAVPLPQIPVNTEAWTIALNASQVIYAGGGVRSAIKSTQLAREAALLDLENVINEALLQVRTGFYRVLLAREQIKVQESNLDLLQQQLKTATDRFEAGTVSSFEKLRAEVAVSNAKVPLITARNDYRLAIEALRQALGFTTNTPESLQKVPEFVGTLDFTPVNFDLPAAFSAAHANRPDLQRLAKLTAVREQDVRTQRAGYYPTLGASAGYQFRNHPYGGNQFNESLNGWTLGLQSNWAIFDGRATAGRVAQAKSVLAQTKLTLDEAQLAVDVEVRRAHSQWQQATELAEASARVVEQAAESVRLATARYNAGTSTQLDVLAAQVDLTTARNNQIQAYYSYNVAVAALRKAMGLADEFVKK